MHGLNKRQIYLLFFLFGFIIILLNFVISYMKMSSEIEKDFINDSKKTLRFDETMIKNRIHHFEHEMEILVKSPFTSVFVQGYLDNDQELIKRNNTHLLDLAKSHEEMMQVRYICNNGNEIARVDRKNIGDGPLLIARESLQSKKDRYYFKEIMQRQEGEVWYSKIDLNVEHGEIEVPYKAVLRIGMPIFIKGERNGMVIFNIFMQPLLDKLQGSKNYDLFLIDNKGNFLFHPNAKYNWSLDLKKEYSLFNELPEIASEILQNRFSNNKENKDIFVEEFKLGQAEKYYLVAKLKSALITSEKNNLIQTFILIGIFVMILGFPFGLIIVKHFEHLSARLSAVIDSLGDGIFILDKEKKINYINNKALGILEYSANELIGHNSHERLQHSDANGQYIEEENCPIHNINITRQQVHSDSNIFVSKSGQAINVEFTATPFFVNHNFEGSITIFRDITQRKQLESEIKLLSKTIEQIDDQVVITNKKGVITYVNSAFCSFTGYSREEAVGQTPRLYKSSRHTASEMKDLWDTILDGRVFRGVIVNKKKNSELYYEEKTITPLLDDKGEISSFVSTGKDITDRIEMEIKLEKLASTDYLTGLYNRFKFEEIFTEEMSRCRRYEEPLSLIMFDIDHFKNVNDTFGHDVGDIVLKEISALVQSHIRKSDILARWGGEEFMILTPGVNRDAAYMLSEILRNLVNEFLFPQAGHVSCSLGVVELLEDESFNSLCQRADKALYEAKESGRNRTVKG